MSRKNPNNKNTTTNIHRIKSNDSIMCKYFCIGLNDFMVKSKSLLDYVNLFLLTNIKRMIK